jgi:Helicase conserved C-terminal domain
MNDTAAAPTLAASVPTPLALRAELEYLMRRDLLGPAGGEEEELPRELGSVRDRYLLGMLAPRRIRLRASENDVLAEGGDEGSEDGAADDSGLATDSLMASSIGLSCTVDGQVAQLEVAAHWGHYERARSETQTTPTGQPALAWKRTPRGAKQVIALAEGEVGPLPIDLAQPGVVLRGDVRKLSNDWLVSLFLVNTQIEPEQGKDAAWVFQAELAVAGVTGDAVFCRRPWQLDDKLLDPAWRHEQRMLAMLYRKRCEFAVGHGVAVVATVDATEPTRASRIVTQVMPAHEVWATTQPTVTDIPALGSLVLDMKALGDPAELSDAALFASLEVLPAAYGEWVTAQRARVAKAGEGLQAFEAEARAAMEACDAASSRIAAGIALLKTDPRALSAFRFANRAMWQQRIHSLLSEGVRAGRAVTLAELDLPAARSWRPFQLAFVLLNLPGITQLDHPERSASADAVADLLWFPTGGGKTEAYLGLTAYTLAIRRQQGIVEGRIGHRGVAVIMRYTLRLLTLQQFQRASALICACEVIRRTEPTAWGAEPFRVGLWVGQRTTPNTIEDAHQALLQSHGQGAGSGTGSPLQLTNCPWCGHEIKPGRDVKAETFSAGRARVFTFCGDALGTCDFSAAQAPGEGLPVLTVDEEIYRRLPDLLIATVDKFAQLPWNGKTQMLFGQVTGECPRHGFRAPCIDDTDSHPASRHGHPAVRSIAHGPLRPPDLIIQDELHLISGPLGSLVGLYETAVDQLCSWTVNGKTVRPKVIASTATIRQAREQMRALFLRDVRVFPPQGLDASDNFFSVQRPPTDALPGRRYLGVCALGRRLKAALIRVYTAELAAAQALFLKYGKAVDPWMTLLGYFNSMRELGGMRRMVDDDVRSRLRDMDRRGLARRHTPLIDELTSRRASRDIPGLLDRMEVMHDPTLPPHAKGERGKGSKPMPLDVVLATNMVSVGVDIKRLGLMVVAGQPKGTSEYIQATSRVGRNDKAPGLVITVYNWARPRDLSHYERFEHYHGTFYQHVEALSVTPFAARAVDRGLSALLAALVRLPAPEYNDNRAAGRLDRTHAIVQQAVESIAARSEEVTGSKAEGDRVRRMLKARIDTWLKRAQPKAGGARLGYQRERDGLTLGLLERAGMGDWDDFTCLGSLRDVEPTVGLILEDIVLDDGLAPVASAAPAAGGAAP